MGKYGNREREDKSVLKEPRCPYCREKFTPPADIPTQLGFFTGGVCSCGATYAFDPSYKNMGEAFMDALTYACKEDWDYALSLESEKDYDMQYLHYNDRDHSVTPRKQAKNPYQLTGNLIFILVKREKD